MKTTLLRSAELSCPSCVAKIEAALLAVQGVTEAKVFFNTGKIEVRHDAQRVPTEALLKVVQSAGYQVRESAF